MTKRKHPKSDYSLKLQKELFPHGFVMINRDIRNWRWFYDEKVWHLYSFLILSANFKDKPFKDFIIHRGELLTSYSHLSESLNKSYDQIRGLLTKLKKTHDIEVNRVGNGLLIKLENYNENQGVIQISSSSTPTLSPDLAQSDTTAEPMTKERKQGNNFIREKEIGFCSVDNSKSSGGLVKFGDILARQQKTEQLKYHFDQFPPDWEEVQRYATEKNMDINLNGFYQYYQNNGWCEQSGKKLDGWHFALCYTQKTREYL